MAFCNSCGAALNPGTKFCNKCGAVAAASGAVPAAAGPIVTPAGTPATPSKGGSGALKIILIIVGVIVLIGIIGLATVGFIGYRIAKNSHISQDGDHVKVDTPFGKVETSGDPDKVVKNLGVDPYPGATVQKGASSASFGNIHTVTATFKSGDSLDKVCAFYKAKYPDAMVSTSDENRCTIVSNDKKNMININIEADGDSSRIQISNVSKKASSSD
jgi:uncharacterized OB-fold protein